jgi:hypothetical protein
VHAIWNGATHVARWDVVEASGADDANDDERRADDRAVVASAAWNGLDTVITVERPLQTVIVVARDDEGRRIGRSPAVAATP